MKPFWRRTIACASTFHARLILIAVLLAAGLCLTAGAQSNSFASTVSPKLRQFLTDHPAAALTLSNTLAEAFTTRTYRIYYFYSDDESIPRAAHTYAGPSMVWITVRENQQPADEFVGLIFEALNSEGGQRFGELADLARVGRITKPNFVREVMRQEFQAVKKTRAMLGGFQFTPAEIEASYFYSRFIQCPDDFEQFLVFKKKVSPNRDQVKEYEKLYDTIRSHA